MSKSGKLLRGLKWHKFRDVDGVYPEDISADTHKMEEIEFYLEFVNARDSKKVHQIMEKIMLLDLSNKPTLMSKKAKELDNPELLITTKSKGKK